MNYPTEKSPFLEDKNNDSEKRVSPPPAGLSLLWTHFLVGFLGVIVGSTLVMMRISMMERSSSVVKVDRVPLWGDSHSSTMEFSKRVVDKGNWIEGFGISRGVLTITSSADGRLHLRHLYASGQSPFDGTKGEGNDMASQMQTDLKFINVTLNDAKMTMCDIVRINVFTTDMEATLAVWDDVYVPWINNCPVRPASTLVGVTTLFAPDLLVEIQVEAVSSSN
jgi:enamine deaminase RidA (YjgF/YER057c/UK114 family)